MQDYEATHVTHTQKNTCIITQSVQSTNSIIIKHIIAKRDDFKPSGEEQVSSAAMQSDLF